MRDAAEFADTVDAVQAALDKLGEFQAGSWAITVRTALRRWDNGEVELAVAQLLNVVEAQLRIRARRYLDEIGPPVAEGYQGLMQSRDVLLSEMALLSLQGPVREALESAVLSLAPLHGDVPITQFRRSFTALLQDANGLQQAQRGEQAIELIDAWRSAWSGILAAVVPLLRSER